MDYDWINGCGTMLMNQTQCRAGSVSFPAPWMKLGDLNVAGINIPKIFGSFHKNFLPQVKYRTST